MNRSTSPFALGQCGVIFLWANLKSLANDLNSLLLNGGGGRISFYNFWYAKLGEYFRKSRNHSLCGEGTKNFNHRVL